MSAQCIIVTNTSSAAVVPMLSNITTARGNYQGVAIFGRCGSARVSELLSNDAWRSKTLFISSDGADCGYNLEDISELTSAFEMWRVSVVHVVVERVDFQSRTLGTWSHDVGTLLRRYVATLEAVVKHDVTTRVILHVDIAKSRSHDVTLLCRDPFVSSYDFADIILSTVYSFTGVYKNLYKLSHVYNILYAHNIP